MSWEERIIEWLMGIIFLLVVVCIVAGFGRVTGLF